MPSAHHNLRGRKAPAAVTCASWLAPATSSTRFYPCAGNHIPAKSHGIDFNHSAYLLLKSQGNPTSAFRSTRCPAVVNWHFILAPRGLAAYAARQPRQARTTPSKAVTITHEECILACDVGTGGTKVAIIDQLGHIAASGFSAHARTTQSQR